MEGVVEREDHGPGVCFCFDSNTYACVYVKENLLK